MANQIIQGGNGLVNIPVSWSIWVLGVKLPKKIGHLASQAVVLSIVILIILVFRACFFRHIFRFDDSCSFFFSEAGVLIPDLVPKVVMLMASCRCKATRNGRGEPSPRFPTNQNLSVPGTPFVSCFFQATGNP